MLRLLPRTSGVVASVFLLAAVDVAFQTLLVKPRKKRIVLEQFTDLSRSLFPLGPESTRGRDGLCTLHNPPVTGAGGSAHRFSHRAPPVICVLLGASCLLAVPAFLVRADSVREVLTVGMAAALFDLVLLPFLLPSLLRAAPAEAFECVLSEVARMLTPDRLRAALRPQSIRAGRPPVPPPPMAQRLPSPPRAVE